MDFVVSNNLAICNVDFVASVLVTSGSTGIQYVDSNVNRKSNRAKALIKKNVVKTLRIDVISQAYL
jgi:hypothetical protein